MIVLLGVIVAVGLLVLGSALCAAVLAKRADARASVLCPATGQPAPNRHELTWDRWLAEERARPRPTARKVRPSIELDADLVDRIDRVAAWSGCTRHELVSAILTHWLASWRPTPR